MKHWLIYISEPVAIVRVKLKDKKARTTPDKKSRIAVTY